MGYLVQLLGAFVLLTAFALAQRGMLDNRSPTYLALNLVGSTVLAVDALRGRQWGFLVLEAVWAVVSAIGLLRLQREQKQAEVSGLGEHVVGHGQ